MGRLVLEVAPHLGESNGAVPSPGHHRGPGPPAAKSPTPERRSWCRSVPDTLGRIMNVDSRALDASPVGFVKASCDPSRRRRLYNRPVHRTEIPRPRIKVSISWRPRQGRQIACSRRRCRQTVLIRNDHNAPRPTAVMRCSPASGAYPRRQRPLSRVSSNPASQERDGGEGSSARCGTAR